LKLHTVNTGNFKLDGGAMFGVVPKSLWQKSYAPDENNLCNWAMRCLLIEDGNRLILIDNGIGDKQDAKFFSHYYLNGDDSLEKSLKSLGFSKADITDVFLTHLHFDHCGGSIELVNNKLVPAFKNAAYWSNHEHWQWATQPNAREKASFLKDNILPIQDSGQLQFIKPAPLGTTSFFANDIEVKFFNGHTQGMMLPVIKYKDRKIVFMADLLPSAAHIPIPYVMAYDTQPLTTLQEREQFWKEAADENYVLFLEHDYYNECITLTQTDKGIKLGESFKLSEV